MTNIVYFGSPTFSAQILESLITTPSPPPTSRGGATKSPLLSRRGLRGGINITAVVTNPDRPVGRSKILTPTPVAQLATKYKIPIFKPEKLDQQNLTHLALLKPDLFLVVAYGKIIPQSWLDAPKISTINVHFSLLPKYRGALCIQEAIKNQDSQTGVTLMEMDAQLDHGPIIAAAKQEIDIDDDVESLANKLAHLGQALLEKSLPLYLAGKSKPKAQNHKQATFTPSHKTLNHQNAFIPYKDLQANPLKIHALIRSLNPQPGAWTQIDGKKIKILKTKITDNKLEILNIQVPGKNPISWDSFQKGL